MSLVPSNLQVGDFVKAGKAIGISDGSGIITAPHLHFTLKVGGTAIDPASNDLNSETITKDWNKKFGSLEILDKHGLEFNSKWFQNKLDHNFNIYDFGKGYYPSNGKYYGLELNMIQNYQHVTPRCRTIVSCGDRLK